MNPASLLNPLERRAKKKAAELGMAAQTGLATDNQVVKMAGRAAVRPKPIAPINPLAGYGEVPLIEKLVPQMQVKSRTQRRVRKEGTLENIMAGIDKDPNLKFSGPDRDLLKSALFIRQKVGGVRRPTASLAADGRIDPSAVQDVLGAMRTPEGRARLQAEITGYRQERTRWSQTLRSPRSSFFDPPEEPQTPMAGMDDGPFTFEAWMESGERGWSYVEGRAGQSIPREKAADYALARGWPTTFHQENDEEQVNRLVNEGLPKRGAQAAPTTQRGAAAGFGHSRPPITSRSYTDMVIKNADLLAQDIGRPIATALKNDPLKQGNPFYYLPGVNGEERFSDNMANSIGYLIGTTLTWPGQSYADYLGMQETSYPAHQRWMHGLSFALDIIPGFGELVGLAFSAGAKATGRGARAAAKAGARGAEAGGRIFTEQMARRSARFFRSAEGAEKLAARLGVTTEEAAKVGAGFADAVEELGTKEAADIADFTIKETKSAIDNAVAKNGLPPEAADDFVGFVSGARTAEPANSSQASRRMVAPEELNVNPKIQYKQVSDQKNMIGTPLAGRDYVVNQGGELLAWERLDGSLDVAHGHHRAELAKRARRFVEDAPGNTFREVDRQVPVRLIREADGWGVDDVRRAAAIENLRNGDGTALDAAMVLREMGLTPNDFEDMGISLRKSLARNTQAMMGLSDDALRLVRLGEAPESAAAGIGAVEGLDSSLQASALKRAAASGHLSYEDARRFGQVYRDSVVRDTGGLPGFEDWAPAIDTLDEEAALVKASTRKILDTRANLQKGVDVEALAGETIDRAQRQELLEKFGAKAGLVYKIDKLFEKVPSLAELRRELALKIKEGTISHADAEKQLRKAIEGQLDVPISDLISARPVWANAEAAGGLRSATEPPGPANVARVADAPDELLSGAELEPPGSPKPTTRIETRSDVETALRDHFKYTDEQVAANMALMDARAKGWGRDTGRNWEEWYPDRFHAIGSDGEEAASVIARNMPNPQDVRGLTAFLKGRDGKALVYAMEQADASTWAHELAHVWRRMDLPAEDAAVALKALGYKAWNEDAEEAFARAFERYLRDGKTPHNTLRAVFDKFKTWLADVYHGLRGTAVTKRVDPDVAKIFDRLTDEAGYPRASGDFRADLSTLPDEIPANGKPVFNGQEQFDLTPQEAAIYERVMAEHRDNLKRLNEAVRTSEGRGERLAAEKELRRAEENFRADVRMLIMESEGFQRNQEILRRMELDGRDPAFRLDAGGEDDVLAQSAWHGSPHKFDKFKLNDETVGTGEGAQAFGHGLYFAESEDLAKWYRDRLSKGIDDEDAIYSVRGKKVSADEVDVDMADLLNSLAEGGYDATWKGYQNALLRSKTPEDAKFWRQQLRRVENLKDADVKYWNTGALYKVELRPTDDEWLLLDKPLSQQSEKVRAALDDPYFADALDDWADRRGMVAGELTGYQAIKALGELDGPDYVSQKLLEKGVRGNKFLDGASRKAGEGKYNFVVFDDSDVEVLDVLYQKALDDHADDFKAKPERKAILKEVIGRMDETVDKLKGAFSTPIGALKRAGVAGSEERQVAMGLVADIETINANAARITSGLLTELYDTITAQYGKGWRKSAKGELEDLARKIHAGDIDSLTDAQKAVHAVWVKQNKALTKEAEARGVLVDRKVWGEMPAELVGKRAYWYGRDADGNLREMRGYIDDVGKDWIKVQADRAYGGEIDRLGRDQSFSTVAMVKPEFYFPRKLNRKAVEMIKNGGTFGDQSLDDVLEYLVRTNQAKDKAQADNAVKEFFNHSERTVATGGAVRLERARMGVRLPDEFYDFDFAGVASDHLTNSVRRLQIAQRWGHDGIELAEAVRHLDGDKQGWLDTVDMALGMGRAGLPHNAVVRKIANAEGAWQAASKLTGLTTAVKQVAGLAPLMTVYGGKATVEGAGRLLKAALTKADISEIARIKSSGAIDSALLEILTRGSEEGSLGRLIADKSLTYSGVKPVDSMMRYWSAASGRVAVEDAVLKVRMKGVHLQDSPSLRLLRDWFFYSDEEIKKMVRSVRDGKLELTDSLAAKAYHGGVKVQGRARSGDIPMFVHQMPMVGMFFRFQQTNMALMGVLDFAAKEARRGNVKPMARMLTAGAAVGYGSTEAANQLNAWISGKEKKPMPKKAFDVWVTSLMATSMLGPFSNIADALVDKSAAGEDEFSDRSKRMVREIMGLFSPVLGDDALGVLEGVVEAQKQDDWRALPDTAARRSIALYGKLRKRSEPDYDHVKFMRQQLKEALIEEGLTERQAQSAVNERMPMPAARGTNPDYVKWHKEQAALKAEGWTAEDIDWKLGPEPPKFRGEPGAASPGRELTPDERRDIADQIMQERFSNLGSR